MSSMIRLTRRELLLSAGSLSLAGTAAAGTTAGAAVLPVGTPTLPDTSAFAATDITYLDSGSYHPISLGARAAIDSYLSRRSLDPKAEDARVEDDDVLAKFARLVNVDKEEVAFVQSTTAGEQMVLRALGIPESGGHIITDTLHFFGSFPLYEELSHRGMEVSWLHPVDGRIPLEDMKKALRRDTKLIALSLVSTFNGFEHDLKSVCDLAHANGTLVYADIIHAAGCIPVDLRSSGVDFAACASYKWLMGDFGLGFVYARRDLWSKLKRINYGYFGVDKFEPHVYPLDPAGPTIAGYAFKENATGAFALGTHGESVLSQLDYSLSYLDRLGVDNIQKHAQTLTERLKVELPRLGYPLLTPLHAPTPLVTCLYQDARTQLAPRLKQAKIRMTLGSNRFRVSVSVFNTMRDVDRLLSVLGHA